MRLLYALLLLVASRTRIYIFLASNFSLLCHPCRHIDAIPSLRSQRLYGTHKRYMRHATICHCSSWSWWDFHYVSILLNVACFDEIRSLSSCCIEWWKLFLWSFHRHVRCFKSESQRCRKTQSQEHYRGTFFTAFLTRVESLLLKIVALMIFFFPASIAVEYAWNSA